MLIRLIIINKGRQMSEKFSINLKGQGPSRNLIYKESDHVLEMYFDMSGIPEYDWVGDRWEIGEWTLPKGEKISIEKKNEIIQNIKDWDKKNNIKLKF